jgi:hypothetical protein
MEPLEFMERLAALVPRPRLHLIRFHGVLAPNAKLRSKIVPAPAPPATESPSEDAHGQGAPRTSLPPGSPVALWIVASSWKHPPSVSQSSLSRAYPQRISRLAI